MNLTISHLSKQYRRDLWGLRDFDLELKPGVTGLPGPNGAGKSTLMRMLATILALALGILTGSSKTFEVVYALWMVLILQKIPALDFVGMTNAGPWQAYLGLSIFLLAVSGLVRQIQIKNQ